jgi:hypothetical protein
MGKNSVPLIPIGTPKKKKTVSVFVAWEHEAADELEEYNKIDFSKVSEYEFKTHGEADAFIYGINEGNGWDSPKAISGKHCSIANGKLYID